MTRLWRFVPLAALIGIVVLGVFMLLHGGPRQTISEGLVGRPAPTFALMRVDGQGMTTSDAFAGRPHVINLFASWCTPCRAEQPQLMALKAQGVAIVGVAYKDRAEDTRAFLAELGDPYAVSVQDPEGRFGLELGAAGVPESFVVGADGTIRAAYRGPLTEDVIRGAILPALQP